MRISGGLVGDRVLSPEDVSTLAYLPSKEVLLSRLMGQMCLPMTQFVGVLSANLRGLMTVLQGRLKQVEAAPVSPPAAVPATAAATLPAEAAAPAAPPVEAAVPVPAPAPAEGPAQTQSAPAS